MSHASETEFEGLDAVELVTPALRISATRDIGPRIAFLGKPDGENILLWNPGEYTRGAWDLRGGHRVWMTRPMADECEDTYAADNGPCELELIDEGFRLTGEENPTNCTRRGFSVRAIDDTTLEVDNFVINTGELLYSGGLWALTCSLPAEGTRYGIPLGDGSEWDAFNMVSFRRWAGHGQGGFNDPQINISNDVLTIDPAGIENKRMLMSHHGIIAMSDPLRSLTFAKQVTHQRSGNYPMNTNLAFYIGPDNFMVEMETMGPEGTLKPGESFHHLETWVLRDGATELDDAQTLIDLFQ
jgi:hypothetical protein